MYTEQEINRVIELSQKIEGNKAHEYSAPTYKDSPDLREIAEIMLSHADDTVEVLEEKIPALWYLTKCYDEMCRWGMSLKYYKILLSSHIKRMGLRKYSSEEKKQFEDAFYRAVRARNQFGECDCTDLAEIVKGPLSDKEIEKIIKDAKKSRAGLPVNDPVELTDEYLAVIDEVEALVEKNKRIELCYEYWSLKCDYLMERGIVWESPATLNPGVMFD